MQAYHNGDRFYGQQAPPYGPQPQYFQQFPGYGYPQSGPQPIAAPFPVYPNGMNPGTPAPGRPRPLDREPSRSSTPGRPGMKPLKSAMKRTRTPDHGPPPGEAPSLVRGRSSDTIQRQRTRSGSRMRSNSIPRFTPSHIILTLRSTNLLHVENLFDSEAAAELTEQVLGFWQHGINRQSHNRGKWKVEFAGSPWASVGLDGILAGRMINRLFLVLGRLGYSYASTVNVANPWKAPQLIFAECDPDVETYVFSMMLSKSGDRLTILDGPPDLTQELGIGLRANFPRKITTDRATEDGLHIYEVRKGTYGVEVDRSLLVAFILQFFSGAGFELCGSVPLGTRGFLHLGQRRELWVFKFRSPMRQKEFRRPSSRQSRRSRGDHEA
ncbi:hypothetical protein C8Q76DRAFT_272072 [Earliella scabrosa]|nr:hypothetical protein C8Q76DRAFT_272072 [Earliella scabrosa]